MAYVNSLTDQEQENANQQQSNNTQAPTLSEGGGGASARVNSLAGSNGSQVSNPTSAQQSKTPQGNFADINNYLRVNGGQNFGQDFANKIGTDVSTAQNTLGSVGSQFDQRADAATIKDSNDLTSQVATDPNSINATDFGKLLNANYTGPQSFTDAADLYQQAQGAVQNAQNNAESSKTEGGRFALLNNYFGNSNYGQGQKSLDNLLIQNDPNSQQALSQIQQNANALGGQFNQTAQDLGNYGSQAKATTAATNTAARNALGLDSAGNLSGTGAIGDINTAVTNQYNQALTNAQNYAKDVASGNYGAIDPSVAAAIANNGGGLAYGTNLGDYLTLANPSTITQESVATPDQIARMAALTTLAQQANAGLSNNLTGNDAGQYAGGNGLFNFNAQGYGNAVNTAQGRYTAQQQAVTQQQNQIQSYLNQLNGISDKSRSLQDIGILGSMSGKTSSGTVQDLINKYQAALNAIPGQVSAINTAFGVPDGTEKTVASNNRPVIR